MHGLAVRPIRTCRCWRHLLLSLLAVAVVPDVEAAQSGFGVDGLVTTEFPEYVDAEGRDILIDSAGRIVVAGLVRENAAFSGADQFAIARYLRDGQLDPAFDADGRVVSALEDPDVHPNVGVAQDNAGRIVIAGGHIGLANELAVMRFSSNGSVDATFGAAGLVTTSFVGSSFSSGRDVAIANGDEPVVAAFADTGPAVFGVAAYEDNGNLNPAFDGDGLATNDFPTHAQWADIRAIGIDDAGRYVVAGYLIDPAIPPFSDKAMGVARYRPDGSLDPAFGTNGRVVVAFDQWSEAHHVVIDAEGRIIVGGCVVTSGDMAIETQGFALARLNPDGALDASFGEDGLVVTPIGPEQGGCVRGIAVDGRGRIVVAGWAVAEKTQFFAVARYTDAGIPDASFGSGGQVITTFPSQTLSHAHAVAVDAEGRILVAGYVRRDTDTPRHYFGVACYNEYGFPCRDMRYEYAAKVICGVQAERDVLTLARGGYATTINIHNPGTQAVTFFKKLALTRPPHAQKPGDVLPIAEDVLHYDQALAVDCPDLQRRLYPQGFPDRYIEGFVIVQSPRSLDVTSVYSTAALSTSGRIDLHSGIDVEKVEERRLGTDLSVSKSAEVFEFPFGDSFTFFAVLYTIDIDNHGPQTATAVELTDELALELTNTVGTVQLLEAPLEIPPGAQVTSIVQSSPTASLVVTLGDMQPDTSAQVRFWALAAVYVPPGVQPSATLRNTVSAVSDEVEIDPSNSSVTIQTPLVP